MRTPLPVPVAVSMKGTDGATREYNSFGDNSSLILGGAAATSGTVDVDVPEDMGVVGVDATVFVVTGDWVVADGTISVVDGISSSPQACSRHMAASANSNAGVEFEPLTSPPYTD